jgi:hypothetical protein
MELLLLIVYHPCYLPLCRVFTITPETNHVSTVCTVAAVLYLVYATCNVIPVKDRNLCILIVCLCIFIVPAGTLRPP